MKDADYFKKFLLIALYFATLFVRVFAYFQGIGSFWSSTVHNPSGYIACVFFDGKCGLGFQGVNAISQPLGDV